MPETLPLKSALRCPICISYNTDVRISKGAKIILPDNPRFGLVAIGFFCIPSQNEKLRNTFSVNGTIRFKGFSRIGVGATVHVGWRGQLDIGGNFLITGASSIDCRKSITIKDIFLCSKDCYITDSDQHIIYGLGGEVINGPAPIIIERDTWVGNGVTILKGSHTPPNCVIGANSLITAKGSFSPNTIIAGNPAKSVKEIKCWKK